MDAFVKDCMSPDVQDLAYSNLFSLTEKKVHFVLKRTVKDEVQYGLFLLFILCVLQTGSEELLALGGSKHFSLWKCKGGKSACSQQGFQGFSFSFFSFPNICS